MKPRCVAGSHTTSPVTPAAAGSLVALKVTLMDSLFASSAARCSATLGAICATGATLPGGRSQPKIPSTKQAAAAIQPYALFLLPARGGNLTAAAARAAPR